MKKWDMYCDSHFIIASFSMVYFLGFAIGSFFVPGLSDKHGRKNWLIYCLLGQTTFNTVMLCLPSNKPALYVLIPILFLNGITTSGRVTAGYCMMCDFSPKKYQSALGCIWNMAEGMCVIYVTIYFRYISKKWFWLELFGLGQGVLTMILTIFFIPESPKWLYDNKKYKECFNSL